MLSNGDMSTSFGFRPALITANAVEQYVIAGIKTSYLFLRFKDFRAIVSASVPLAQLIAYLAAEYLANFFSKSKTLEPITFTGHQIRLLDLQRAIMEKKNMKEGSDFDLVLMDAEDTSKIYSGEDTYIPKNTAVVVRKVVKKAGQGLLSRFGKGAIAA